MSIRLEQLRPKQLDTLKPLNLKAKLAGTPPNKPLYTVDIKNNRGEDISVAGNPRVTRALVALIISMPFTVELLLTGVVLQLLLK